MSLPAWPFATSLILFVLIRQLDELGHWTGKSINTLALETLSNALDAKGRADRLKRYVTWSEADAREFDDAVGSQHQVDEALWR